MKPNVYAIDVDIVIKTKLTKHITAYCEEDAGRRFDETFDIGDVHPFDLLSEADVEKEIQSIERIN